MKKRGFCKNLNKCFSMLNLSFCGVGMAFSGVCVLHTDNTKRLDLSSLL